MEIDIGNFHYTGYNPSNTTLKEMRLMMNEAFMSLWCITSAPLITCNDLRNMDQAIFNILTDKYAVGVNQNYLNHGGDNILYFNITDKFRQEYLNQVESNGNMTEMFYKPMPTKFGDAAFVFLNRDETQSGFHKMNVEFNQLPLTYNHNDDLECMVYDIWNKSTIKSTSYNANLYPQSVKFILLSNCTSVTVNDS